jgi:hypothetical protein
MDDIGMILEASATMYDDDRNELLQVHTPSMTRPNTTYAQSIETAINAVLKVMYGVWDKKSREAARKRESEIAKEGLEGFEALSRLIGPPAFSTIEIVLRRKD